MSWLDAARARIRLLSRHDSDARFDDEIRFHIDMEAQQIARTTGVDVREARRRATIHFGGVEGHRETLRDGRGLRWLGGLRLDLTLGVRMLRKSPGLTVVGVLGMAVAVAIGCITYGVIYTFFGRDIPIDGGDRVVMIGNYDPATSDEARETHLHDLGEWKRSVPAFAEIAAFHTVDRNFISLNARPEPVRVAEMTASGFRIARVQPILGRFLVDEDERPGATPVVVIREDVWRERFAGDSSVIGRTIALGVAMHTIVGVMPRTFGFPINNRVWTPFRLDPMAFPPGKAPAIRVFARLAAGASRSDAETQAALLQSRRDATSPQELRGLRPRVFPYALAFADAPNLAWVMHLIQFAISLLLVVIGVNVAVLVYARTAGRAGEIAIRTALGASRSRIVAQLFAEAFVLSGIAAAVGLAVGSLGLRYMQVYSEIMVGEEFPYWWHFGVSTGMVLYVLVLAAVGAAVVGVLPAIQATGRGVRARLQQLGAGGGGMKLGRAWTTMIVAQVAIAVTLLPIVAYGIVDFVQQRRAARLTYATSQWMTAALHVDEEQRGSEDGLEPDDDTANRARHAALANELVVRLRRDPAVSDALLMSAIPGDESAMRIVTDTVTRTPQSSTQSSAQRARQPGQATDAAFDVRMAAVDPTFFRAFGVPLLTGRTLDRTDAIAVATDSSLSLPIPIVVNQPFAATVFAGGNVIGRRVRVAPPSRTRASQPAARRSDPWYEIVGVVADFAGADRPSAKHLVMYRPFGMSGPRRSIVAVQTKGIQPASFAGTLRQTSVAVDPMLRIMEARPLDDTLNPERVLDRVIFAGGALFVLSVLLLSAAGIHALMAFTIERRRREIGIRSALGAGARQVITAVMSHAARQVGIGLAIGMVLATAALQGILGWTWSTVSILVMLGVALFMGAVGIVAAWRPARAALRIDPTEALRSE